MRRLVTFMLSAVFVSRGFILEQSNRRVVKVLKVSNGGRYGFWTTPQYCPKGTFAAGFNMKIESNQVFGDDTALNAISLTCSNLEGHAQIGKDITSGEGAFGSWGKLEGCNQQYHSANFLTSFALQVEGPQGSGDDTSATYVKFTCRDIAGDNAESEIFRPPGHGIFGNWGEWSDSCDNNTAICGLNTKVESVQGSGDDTALNDVVFYCCSDTETQGASVIG